jgi:hypothetical protein
MGSHTIQRLGGGWNAPRLWIALASALGVAGCPALQDDPYSKVDGDDGASGATADSLGGSPGRSAGTAGTSGMQAGASAGGTAPDGFGGLLDVGSGGQSLLGGTGGDIGSGGTPAAGGFEPSSGGSAGIPASGTGGAVAAGGSGVGGTTGSGGLTSSGGSGVGGTTGSGGLTNSGGEGGYELGGSGGQPSTGGGAGMGAGGTGGRDFPTGGSAGSAGEGECGDGIVQGEEECDAGDDTVIGCTDDCTVDCSELYSGAVAYEGEPSQLHCIYATTMGRTWDESVGRCVEDGAHLATITSDVEQAAALDALGDESEVWIGATDERDASDPLSGPYEWVTDETWGYEPSEGFADDTSSFCNSDCEHCAALQNDGEWQAATCDEGRTPLCEWEPPGW